MDQKTIHHLNQINLDFYTTVSKSFNQSRMTAWKGWSQVLKEVALVLGDKKALTILDLGCGNGRWGTFVAAKAENLDITYVGIDGNSALLQYACQDLLPKVKVLQLSLQDLQSFLAGDQAKRLHNKVDLIVMFGVWHHLPAKENRANFIKDVSQLLTPTGILTISCWRFLRSDHLQQRLVDSSVVSVNQDNLEEGDYFLDWRAGTPAIRYCHDTDPQEIVNQAAAANLKLQSSFSADGKTGDLNDYYLFSPG